MVQRDECNACLGDEFLRRRSAAAGFVAVFIRLPQAGATVGYEWRKGGGQLVGVYRLKRKLCMILSTLWMQKRSVEERY